jgi:UPF0755 protein
LERQGLVRNHLIFSLYLKYKQEGHRFQAGTYEMVPGMTFDEIIGKLNRGEVRREPMIRFTIPEGFTLEQIADTLERVGLIDRERFFAAVDPKNVASPLVRQIPDHSGLKYPLEGYLFPETYELKEGATEQDIVNRMVDELERKLSQLPGWEAQLHKLGISFHEMMTIASLIEREVVVAEERPIVSGVIYNRLHKGWNLQIDATVQYSLDEPKERLLHKDLEVDSPYNTYLHPGLPPGPIASPSLASIEAALYPAESEYMFYVTKKDGSREHLFAETYEEHLENIRKSEQTMQESE